MSKAATTIINARVKWAVHPSDQTRIAYIEGLWNGETLPHENEVITRSFLVDPQTRQPVPVRVVQILEWPDPIQGQRTLVVVVARSQ